MATVTINDADVRVEDIELDSGETHDLLIRHLREMLPRHAIEFVAEAINECNLSMAEIRERVASEGGEGPADLYRDYLMGFAVPAREAALSDMCIEVDVERDRLIDEDDELLDIALKRWGRSLAKDEGTEEPSAEKLRRLSYTLRQLLAAILK